MILFLLSVHTGKIHLGQKKADEGLSQGVARGLGRDRSDFLRQENALCLDGA